MLTDMKGPTHSNQIWKDRVKCLNKFHNHLKVLGHHVEEIRGQKNRTQARLLINRLVGILYQLDVLMDNRGR
ncbi:MAG: hypothetical protein V3U54_07865 [Thermodesulfobacteriota bacterium]